MIDYSKKVKLEELEKKYNIPGLAEEICKIENDHKQEYVCPECAKLYDEYQYCDNDGKEVIKFRICQKCGEDLTKVITDSSKADKCPVCGEQLSNAQKTAISKFVSQKDEAYKELEKKHNIQGLADEIRKLFAVSDSDLLGDCVCPDCGAEYRDQKFCKKDGTPLIKKKICPSCGHGLSKTVELKKELNFCPDCGEPLPKGQKQVLNVNTVKAKPDKYLKVCLNCGQRIIDAEKVKSCPKCGADVAELKCHKCGEPFAKSENGKTQDFSNDYHFCPKCGTPNFFIRDQFEHLKKHIGLGKTSIDNVLKDSIFLNRKETKTEEIFTFITRHPCGKIEEDIPKNIVVREATAKEIKEYLPKKEHRVLYNELGYKFVYSLYEDYNFVDEDGNIVYTHFMPFLGMLAGGLLGWFRIGGLLGISTGIALLGLLCLLAYPVRYGIFVLLDEPIISIAQIVVICISIFIMIFCKFSWLYAIFLAILFLCVIFIVCMEKERQIKELLNKKRVSVYNRFLIQIFVPNKE